MKQLILIMIALSLFACKKNEKQMVLNSTRYYSAKGYNYVNFKLPEEWNGNLKGLTVHCHYISDCTHLIKDIDNYSIIKKDSSFYVNIEIVGINQVECVSLHYTGNTFGSKEK